jgi:hypothetical protein
LLRAAQGALVRLIAKLEAMSKSEAVAVCGHSIFSRWILKNF